MQSPSRPTALITGGAAGIGASFARALARDGYRLVLVDRNGEGLQRFAGSFDADTEVVTADLTVEGDLARVEQRCREGVDLLVNNAGFGHPTEFLSTSAVAELAMSKLHMDVVLRLTLAALPGMIERGRGGIINLGSVLGFFPSSTYSASKAWVINFSQSAFTKARPSGVTVTVLCPGFTRTEFHDSAGMNMTKIPGFLWLEADALVKAALSDWRQGKAVSIPGWRNKTIAALSRLLPMRLILRIHAGTGKHSLAVRERTPVTRP
ncbi:SDR family NAD(P)-dependent oxidoreductase [Glycomyces luteolus]|uniref:SDR family NAD(P)-dependent oxidoreductase n=1 Tax=Glycomyces luteolus TaxID=2670330 RepID=A0A9X3PDE9_9ACTN|nr:SDR family NAD(P)-dependent oxidoreductase [Glycomyces luteolus]MDA1361493.1 SDR family NAD(P)-dependent oxidoreductase [Glycomyces luteolus]